jgi:homoserine dehydrogenase
MLRTRRVVLAGLGSVGGAVLRLLDGRAADLRARHGLVLEVVGAMDSRGGAVAPGGLVPGALVAQKSRGTSVAELPGVGRPGADVDALLAELAAAGAPADLLVVAGPGDLRDGGAGLAAVLAARRRGTGVVLADKAPLVVAWDVVTDGTVPVRYSACVGAALPTVDLARAVLVSAAATRVEIVLNSTCQRVLGDVERGSTVAAAVAGAQRAGVAEADPSADVDGTDTAVKLVVLAAALGHPVPLRAVATTGIRDVDPGWVRAERARGRAVVLLGTAVPGTPWALTVAPAALDGDHPLARMGRHETGLVVDTDVAGRIAASGRHHDVVPTAAAVLRDLVLLA